MCRPWDYVRSIQTISMTISNQSRCWCRHARDKMLIVILLETSTFLLIGVVDCLLIVASIAVSCSEFPRTDRYFQNSSGHAVALSKWKATNCAELIFSKKPNLISILTINLYKCWHKKVPLYTKKKFIIIENDIFLHGCQP